MSKDQALFDLGYEWRMSRKMYSLLSVLPTDEDPVRDALTESLVLHVRNLIETFWGSNQGDAARQALGITHEQMPAGIGPWYGAASKCVVHLPDDRPAAKTDWDFAVIGPALEAKVEALRNAGTIPTQGWEGDRDPRSKLLLGGDPTPPVTAGALMGRITPTGAAKPPDPPGTSVAGGPKGLVGPQP
jgi:hypothetical protein